MEGQAGSGGEPTDGLTLQRYELPLGGADTIGIVVASEEGEPKSVVVEYGDFLELWATLHVAVETLRHAGIAPKDNPFGADPLGGLETEQDEPGAHRGPPDGVLRTKPEEPTRNRS